MTTGRSVSPAHGEADLGLSDVRHSYHGLGRQRYHTLEAGRGDASLMLFPAVGDRARSYRELLRVLAASLEGVAHVSAVDPPGYGPVILDGNTIPSFDELFAWAEGVGSAQRAPTVFLGNSSGAAMAAAAACGAGSRSVALVMICWPDWRVAEPPMAALIPSDQEELRRLLGRAWASPPVVAPNMAEILLRRYSSPAFREHVLSFNPAEATHYYDRYEGPLLFIGGEADGLVPASAVNASATRRAGAQLQIIPRCGHFPHKERCDQLGATVLDFVEPLLRRDQDSSTVG